MVPSGLGLRWLDLTSPFICQVTLLVNINCDGAECEVDTLSVIRMTQNDQVNSFNDVVVT